MATMADDEILTCRSIDKEGNLVENTGFLYRPGGSLADLLAQRVGPVVSQPQTNEFIFALESKDDRSRGVGIFPPGNKGPPMHYHPNFDEHFEVACGEFLFVCNGVETKASAGDKVLIEKGQHHTFRNVGEEVGATIVEARPSSRLDEVIATLFGMAHDGKLAADGSPPAMLGIIMAAEYDDDTVFIDAEFIIPIAKWISPVLKLFGVRCVDPEYITPEFWSARVEQPKEIPVKKSNDSI